MTESEWLNCTEPRLVLGHLVLRLRRKASDRKLRLFGCACCRRIWHLLPHDANRDFVAAVEDHPDGSIDDPYLGGALMASTIAGQGCTDDDYWSVKTLGRTYYKLGGSGSLHVATLVTRAVADSGGDVAAERATQAGLFRDIFGNPFRPVIISSTVLAWNNASVVRLAHAAYEERLLPSGTLDNGRLAVLADALEEAGCTDQDVLSHCRQQGSVHVRGCWIIDGILNKS